MQVLLTVTCIAGQTYFLALLKISLIFEKIE